MFHWNSILSGQTNATSANIKLYGLGEVQGDKDDDPMMPSLDTIAFTKQLQVNKEL